MRVLIAGDLCPRFRTQQIIEKGCFERIFNYIAPIVRSCDYSLVNLECPIVDSNSAQAIQKCGPALKASPKIIDAIKHVGFKGVTLANNHIMDFGDIGILNTLSSCRESGLDTVGADTNITTAASVLYKNIEGQTVAIINCCEHEFSIASREAPGANPLNPVSQYQSIKEARAKADYVLIIIHGGLEHFQLPSPRMKQLYRFYIDCGADAVINHHQHCYSGYEIYNEKPIFYGIGNFCFDNQNVQQGKWTEGYMVELNLSIKNVSFHLHPYTQCSNEPAVIPMNNADAIEFESSIEKLNAMILDDNLLENENTLWMKSNYSKYELSLTPYTSRLCRSACYRGLLPKFLSKNRILRLINYIDCEAHRDGMLYYLYSKIH